MTTLDTNRSQISTGATPERSGSPADTTSVTRPIRTVGQFKIDAAQRRRIADWLSAAGLGELDFHAFAAWDVLRTWTPASREDLPLESGLGDGCWRRVKVGPETLRDESLLDRCRAFALLAQEQQEQESQLDSDSPAYLQVYLGRQDRLPSTDEGTAPVAVDILDTDGGFVIRWRIERGTMPEAAEKGMLEAHRRLLDWAGQVPLAEEVDIDLLPATQRAVRARVNDTVTDIPADLIHEGFFGRAITHANDVALLWNAGEALQSQMSYGALAQSALRLAAALQAKGIGQEEPVAVVLPRGPNQIIGVLGILAAGGAYVPIGVDHPADRQRRILAKGGIRHIVSDRSTLAARSELLNHGDAALLLIEDSQTVEPLAAPVPLEAQHLAYIIFTSGSTGEPKGVKITHEAAWNTIADINARFALGPEDRAVAVSSLDFDLSVYDLFGLLSAGGALVLLSEETRKDAAAWVQLVERHAVTVWNTVPALLDMLLLGASEGAGLSSLRLVLASGDWVGLDLPLRLRRVSPHCQFIALGGATEGSIWSNVFEVEVVDPRWASIPYGTPLANQCYRVVNHNGRDCPDGIAGELWIGGRGVAAGYVNNEAQTQRHFVSYRGERWYRTGDLGTYWPDGTIEFFGRVDNQVKLRGYRIELKEIEAALNRHPSVAQSVAAVVHSGNAQHLVAGVTPKRQLLPDKALSAAKSPIGNVGSKSADANASLEQQTRLVARFLFDLLGLDALESKRELMDLPAGTYLRGEAKPLVELWLTWLQRESYLVRDGERIGPGPRHEELEGLARGSVDDVIGQAVSDPTSRRALLALWNRLKERADDFRQILRGELSPLVLLDDDSLSPEALAAQDQGSQLGIECLAAALVELGHKAEGAIEIALLGARTGLLAEQLLKRVDGPPLRFVLLDESLSMIAVLRKRFGTNPAVAGIHTLSNQQLPEGLCYRFDTVVALKSLHRYTEVADGLFAVSQLLRPGGSLFMLEHQALLPIDLISSAVTDNGYAQFDEGRRAAGSPMLDAAGWDAALRAAGFLIKTCYPIPGGLAVAFVAQLKAGFAELPLSSLFEHARKLLPAHMIPEWVIRLRSLPLGTNGKVDRKAFAERFRGWNFDSTEQAGDPPREGRESEIAEIWQNLIDLPFVGREQRFFELGGDSLLATHFLVIVKERYEIELAFRDLFDAPLKDVATAIEEQLKKLQDEPGNHEVGEI